MSDDREYDYKLEVIQRELQSARSALPQLKGLDPVLTLVPDPSQQSNAPCCSFCGKRANKLRKLIAGPAVFICNECVTLAARILGKK